MKPGKIIVEQGCYEVVEQLPSEIKVKYIPLKNTPFENIQSSVSNHTEGQN